MQAVCYQSCDAPLNVRMEGHTELIIRSNPAGLRHKCDEKEPNENTSPSGDVVKISPVNAEDNVGTNENCPSVFSLNSHA